MESLPSVYGRLGAGDTLAAAIDRLRQPRQVETGTSTDLLERQRRIRHALKEDQIRFVLQEDQLKFVLASKVEIPVQPEST